MRKEEVERESIPPEAAETEEPRPGRFAGAEPADVERLDIEAAEQGHVDVERAPELDDTGDVERQ